MRASVGSAEDTSTRRKSRLPATNRNSLANEETTKCKIGKFGNTLKCEGVFKADKRISTLIHSSTVTWLVDQRRFAVMGQLINASLFLAFNMMFQAL